MAYEEALQKISAPVDTDMSAKQYFFVDMDTDGTLKLIGDGVKAIGVLQDKPDGSVNPTVGAVGMVGVTKVFAGEAIAVGDDIASDSASKGKTAATGDIVLGRALTAASGAGVIFSMLLTLSSEPLA